MARPRNRRHLFVVTDAMLPREFELFLDHVARNERKAANTVRCYRTHLLRYCQWCEHHGVNPKSPTPQDVAAWQAEMYGTYSPAAIVCYSSTIRRAYRWCHSRASGRLLPDDPADELHVGSVPLGRSRPIADDDLDMALTTARPDHELYVWMLIEAGTGCRSCQVASLTKHRVHFQDDGRAILSVSGKGKDQDVLAGADIAAELRRYVSGSPGPLWFNAWGHPVTAGNVCRRINQHLKGLGLQDRAHSLRHWYGEHAYALTHDLRTVQELLGHSDPKHTSIYVPVSEPGRAAVADTLSSRLTRKRGVS